MELPEPALRIRFRSGTLRRSDNTDNFLRSARKGENLAILSGATYQTDALRRPVEAKSSCGIFLKIRRVLGHEHPVRRAASQSKSGGLRLFTLTFGNHFRFSNP